MIILNSVIPLIFAFIRPISDIYLLCLAFIFFVTVPFIFRSFFRR